MKDNVSDYQALVSEVKQHALTGPPEEFQAHVDYLWNIWRAWFPENAPPVRPRDVRSKEEVESAAQSLLVELSSSGAA